MNWAHWAELSLGFARLSHFGVIASLRSSAEHQHHYSDADHPTLASQPFLMQAKNCTSKKFICISLIVDMSLERCELLFTPIHHLTFHCKALHMCEFGKIRAKSDNVAQICFVKNIKMQVVGWKISERKNSLDDYFSVCSAGPRRPKWGEIYFELWGPEWQQNAILCLRCKSWSL